MIDSSLVSMEAFIGRGRIIPRTGNNHGPVGKGPDVPGVEMGKLRALSAFVPQGCDEIPTGLVVISPAVDDAGFVPTKGVTVTPLYQLPLTPFFTTHYGGIRTYGGGTSREALRRAKKNASNHNRS